MGDVINSKMIQIIVSTFASVFTVNLLYDISNQKGLWITIFFILDVFSHVVETVLIKCFFTRHERHDTDSSTLVIIITVIRMTITFVLTRLFLDVTLFLIAVTRMKWYDYVNVTLVALAFMLVLFTRIKYIPKHYKVD